MILGLLAGAAGAIAGALAPVVAAAGKVVNSLAVVGLAVDGLKW